MPPMATQSIVGDKSLAFGKRIAKCYRHLRDKKQETVMSRQLLRSGTSIGANVREGLYAQSRKAEFNKHYSQKRCLLHVRREIASPTHSRKPKESVELLAIEEMVQARTNLVR